IEVWVYAKASGEDEKVRLQLTRDAKTRVWSKTVPLADLKEQGVTETIFYGYRAWGPNWPFDPAWKKGSKAGFITDVDDAGNRFNPTKLLLDPYAREVSHDYRTASQRDGSVYQSGGNRAVDTGALAPKGIVLPTEKNGFGTKPTRAFKDDIIYEVHLRG